MGETMAFENQFPPPLPDCHLHTQRYTPRIDKISRPDQIKAQVNFWSVYIETSRTWEREIPDRLRWRHSQIVECILTVLKRIVTFPVSNRDFFELCMLQQGWDNLMIDIESFFTFCYPHYSSQLEYSSAFERPFSHHNISYISHYAQTDYGILSHLYDHPPLIVQPTMEWGLDPERPAVVSSKPEERCFLVGEVGPILTIFGDVPSHRCEVPGCAGAWWFWTALRRHQREMPHRMIHQWYEGNEGLVEAG